MKFFLLLSAVLAASSAVTTVSYLHGSGEEIVYRYYSDVRTGILEPEIFASRFVFRADLHIRNDPTGNGTIFFLRTPEVSVQNGEVNVRDNPSRLAFVPLPSQNDAITRPFYVSYDEQGLVDAIFFAADEPLWTQNIKKAIGSLVQLNWGRISLRYPEGKAFTFTAPEQTIYGESNITYSVSPRSNGKTLVVEKYQDPRESNEDLPQRFTNVIGRRCNREDRQNGFMSTSVRTFSISLKDQPVLKRIVAISKIASTPLRTQRNLQYVFVNQTLRFIGFQGSNDNIEASSFKTYSPTTFTRPTPNEFFNLNDISFGHKRYTPDTYVANAIRLYNEAADYLGETHINNHTRESTQHGLVINRLLNLQKMFNIEHFNQVRNKLSSDNSPQGRQALELFYKLLSNIGTEPSLLFIRDIVTKNEQNPTPITIAAILYQLGHNVKLPNEQILAELEPFMRLDENVDPLIRQPAVLTFATLIYRTFRRQQNSPKLKEYVTFYFNQLKEAKSYQEQLMWLQGLSNIRIGGVFDHLEEIANDQQILNLNYDRHLRAHAIWNLIGPAYEQQERLFETLYSILADSSEHIELRVAALKGIVSTASTAQLSFVFQYIQTVNCRHLYNYFYTAVRNNANSDIECTARANLTQFENQVNELFRNRPMDVNTRVFHYDSVDEETGFGISVYGSSIADELTDRVNQVYYRVSTLINNMLYNNFAVHLKFEGIENPVDTLLDGILTFRPEMIRTRGLFQQSEAKTPVHVELTIVYHDQVVYSRQFDEKRILEFTLKDFTGLISMLRFQDTAINYLLQNEIIVPTEFGLPAKFYIQLPFVTQRNISVTTPNPQEINVASLIRVWFHGTQGIYVYNPLISAVQGVRRIYELDANLPIQFQVQLRKNTQESFRIRFEETGDNLTDVRGVKTYVQSQTLIRPTDIINVMEQTCKLCRGYETVYGRTAQDLEDNEIYSGNLRALGRSYYFGTYDCESTPRFDYEFLDNFGFVSLRKFVVQGVQWFMRNTMMRPVGSCGTLLYSEPNDRRPIQDIEIAIKMNHERIEEVGAEGMVVPDIHSTYRISFIARTPERIVDTQYNAQLEFKHENGQFFTFIDAHVSRRRNDSDEILNVCLERVKNFQPHRTTGQINLYSGYSRSEECVHDEFAVRIEYEGERSAEQDSERVNDDGLEAYTECQRHTPMSVRNRSSYECLLARTALRQYRYTISYEQVPSGIDEVFWRLWHFILTTYPNEYRYEPIRVAGEGSFIVELNYPVAYEEEPIVEVTVSTPEESYIFNEFPISQDYYFTQPDNFAIPRYFRFMERIRQIRTCDIYPDGVVPRNVNHASFRPTGPTQGIYFGNVTNDGREQFAIQVTNFKDERQTERNYLNLQLRLNGNTLDIQSVPVSNDDQIVNRIIASEGMLQYMISSVDYHEWYNLRVIRMFDKIVLILPRLPAIIVYNKNIVRIFTVDSDLGYSGQCFPENQSRN